MNLLNTSVIIEFIIGIFLWWVAIFLITQNPFNKVIRLAFGFLAALSFYFSTDMFFNAAIRADDFVSYSLLFKIVNFSLYLSLAFLFHASSLLIKKKNIFLQTAKICIVYLLAFIMIGLEIFSNFIIDHSRIFAANFSGDLSDLLGKFFWLMGVYYMVTFILIAQNFYICATQEKKLSSDRLIFFIPFIGLGLSILIGPFILLGYYGIIPYNPILPLIDFGLIFVSLIYSIFRYNLFLDEAKVFFGKSFFYSTVTIFFILIIYFFTIFISGSSFDSVRSLILPFILAYLVIASHPLYEWLSTFLRDIIYNPESGYSVVSDDEISTAIKEYSLPERLENNSLLRLSLISNMIKKEQATTPVDALRQILDDAVLYFRPRDDADRRIKSNLKYHLLKMLLHDQAEEGQILWELGFEDYPMKIITAEGRSRQPLFKAKSPSDYNYISRNAFLALKKEAIHSLAWRISYLEKNLAKKH